MRVSDLFEAPISDFNLIGNWDKNSSFRHESDRKMITHPKFVQHLTNKWARTNADFNIYLVNSPEANRHTEIGEVTQEWLDTHLPQASKEIIIKNKEELCSGQRNPVAANASTSFQRFDKK